DGDLDAIVGSGGGVVWIHRGDGAGGFAQAEAITIAEARNPGRGVAGISAKDGAPGWIIAPDRPFAVATEVGPDLGLGRRVISEYLGETLELRRDPGGLFALNSLSARRLDLSARLTFVESWRGPALTDGEG